MTFTVRRDVFEDAEQVDPVHAQVSRKTYRDILSEEWTAKGSDADSAWDTANPGEKS